MDYTNNPITNQHPNAHDYEELDLIYAHLDTNTTLAAVGATDASDVSGTINNNFADIAAQLALIKADVAVALSRQ